MLVILEVYFFLYPFGHFGFTAVTFLVKLPLTQVMVFFFIALVLAVAIALVIEPSNEVKILSLLCNSEPKVVTLMSSQSRADGAIDTIPAKTEDDEG